MNTVRKMFVNNTRQILLRTRKIWHLNCRHKKVDILRIKPVYITFRQKQSSTTGGISYTLRLLLHNLFGKYLLFTNTVGSGILMVIGDIVVQEYEIRGDNCKEMVKNTHSMRYDIQRMGRMFVAGALLGPLHHYVYEWMEKVWPTANVKNTIRKILIDEVVLSPLAIVIFFYSICFLERKSVKETNDELKGKFVIMYIVDCMLWPPIQYFNFRYLDAKYRVSFVNICTVIYNVFMSHMKHNYQIDIEL